MCSIGSGRNWTNCEWGHAEIGRRRIRFPFAGRRGRRLGLRPGLERFESSSRLFDSGQSRRRWSQRRDLLLVSRAVANIRRSSVDASVISLTRPLVFADQLFHELSAFASDQGPKLGAAAIGASFRAAFTSCWWTSTSPAFMSVTCRSREQSRVDIYAVFWVEDADKGPSGQIRSLDIIDGDPYG